MKIQFELKDEEMFFNMVSSQKIFGELAEKLQKEDLEIPVSTIDLIISVLTGIIVENNFFTISYDEDGGKIRSIISFMLGTGTWSFGPFNELWDLFYKEKNLNNKIDIKKSDLWDYLLKNGLKL